MITASVARQSVVTNKAKLMVYISPELKKALAERAIEKGVSMAALASIAISEYLRDDNLKAQGK